jgi:hypothetical protein
LSNRGIPAFWLGVNAENALFLWNMNNSLYVKLMLFALFAIKLSHGQDAPFVTYKTYVNKSQHYEILYPEKWYIKSRCIKNGQAGRETRYTVIENLKNKVVPAHFPTGEKPTEDGSSFQLYVDSVSTTIDIDEQIKAFDLTIDEKNRRREVTSKTTIDGHILRVRNTKGETGCSADFVYNGSYYSLQFYSGSEDQFLNDYPLFRNMLKTFKFR